MNTIQSFSKANTLFISDLHLSDNQPEITKLFFILLNKLCEKPPDALYILGDLFDAWIGDDDVTPLHSDVAQHLKALSHLCPIYYIQGNRDFLLGHRYANQCGMSILNDPTFIELYNTKLLLLHGDLLCTHDKAYQRFRYWIRQPWLTKLGLYFPLTWRRSIARFLRNKSKQHNQTKKLAFLDATEEGIQQYYHRYPHIQWMIHGHTHQPIIELHQRFQRAVLDAWHDKGNMLVFTPNQEMHLIYFNDKGVCLQ